MKLPQIEVDCNGLGYLVLHHEISSAHLPSASEDLAIQFPSSPLLESSPIPCSSPVLSSEDSIPVIPAGGRKRPHEEESPSRSSLEPSPKRQMMQRGFTSPIPSPSSSKSTHGKDSPRQHRKLREMLRGASSEPALRTAAGRSLNPSAYKAQRFKQDTR
ncbi:hypothetical protein OBBRIDRAFT_527901 [Obba rivulosa]|uniref:Uncharacterized protein n=1 Tax=Obba rivulosa TaxID=1052685 RepID=A0A8E2AYC8_9APHY|nr:hypothetical protein OBBRIDRAFT_527901 [Obba rivulosa]